MSESTTAEPTPEAPGPSATARHDALVAEVRERTVREINIATPGTVTLHYKARDITFDVSGEVAFRILSVFHRRRSDGLTDPIDLSSSLVLSGWMVIGMDGLMSVSWEPGTDAREAVGTDLLTMLDRIDDPAGGAAYVRRLVAAAARAEGFGAPGAADPDVPAGLVGRDRGDAAADDGAPSDAENGPGPT